MKAIYWAILIVATWLALGILIGDARAAGPPPMTTAQVSHGIRKFIIWDFYSQAHMTLYAPPVWGCDAIKRQTWKCGDVENVSSPGEFAGTWTFSFLGCTRRRMNHSDGFQTELGGTRIVDVYVLRARRRIHGHIKRVGFGVRCTQEVDMQMLTKTGPDGGTRHG